MTESVSRIVAALKAVPEGVLVSYGEIAAAAGVPSGARLVARVLSSMGDRHSLPWHRVVRADRRIALRRGGGFELQKALLETEGWAVIEDGRVVRRET